MLQRKSIGCRGMIGRTVGGRKAKDQLLDQTMNSVKVLTQGRRVGARFRCLSRSDRTLSPHQSQCGFGTLGQFVDLRIEQGEKCSRLRDIGLFCG